MGALVEGILGVRLGVEVEDTTVMASRTEGLATMELEEVVLGLGEGVKE